MEVVLLLAIALVTAQSDRETVYESGGPRVRIPSLSDFQSVELANYSS